MKPRFALLRIPQMMATTNQIKAELTAVKQWAGTINTMVKRIDEKIPYAFVSEEEASLGKMLLNTFQMAGIHTRRDFLDKASTHPGRAEIAKKTGISSEVVLRFANFLDLMRIEGVDEPYAVLLEASLVDSPLELVKRKPEHLHETLANTIRERNLSIDPPTRELIQAWINNAKGLDNIKIIHHGSEKPGRARKN